MHSDSSGLGQIALVQAEHEPSELNEWSSTSLCVAGLSTSDRLFCLGQIEPLLAGVGRYRFWEVDVDIQVLIIVILVLGRNLSHSSLAHISYLGVY